MKTFVAREDPGTEKLLPPAEPDGSRIGVNYVDAYVRALNVDLPDGRKVTCKRKGLKVLLSVGERKGEAILRRLEHGPDPRAILRHALEEAARHAGLRFQLEDGAIHFEAVEGGPT